MRQFLYLFLLIFMFVSLFGMNSMSMNKDGKMINCPLSTNSLTPCQMGVVQYMTEWQQLFQAPFANASQLLLLGFFFIAILLYVETHLSLAPPILDKLKSYQKEHPDIGFDKLLLALSDGILHSKIP